MNKPVPGLGRAVLTIGGTALVAAWIKSALANDTLIEDVARDVYENDTGRAWADAGEARRAKARRDARATLKSLLERCRTSLPRFA